MIQRTWNEIPYATEQGIISKEQGILAQEQGFCLRKPKSSPDEVFGTHRCRNAGFTVPETADAADVSMRLRERGWAPYRLLLDSEQHVWIAVVIDWQHAA